MDFPPGFFDRADSSSDTAFYRPLRLVTHIDDGAIAAVGALYDELAIDGEVLDLMSSWVSHFTHPPRRLTVLGMNDDELAANPLAAARVCTTSTRTPCCRSPMTPSTPRCAACRSTTWCSRSRCSPTSPGWCVPVA